jgi:hypothetical protein
MNKTKNCNQMKRHLPCHSMKRQAIPGTKLKTNKENDMNKNGNELTAGVAC